MMGAYLSYVKDNAGIIKIRLIARCRLYPSIADAAVEKNGRREAFHVMPHDSICLHYLFHAVMMIRSADRRGITQDATTAFVELHYQRDAARVLVEASARIDVMIVEARRPSHAVLPAAAASRYDEGRGKAFRQRLATSQRCQSFSSGLIYTACRRFSQQGFRPSGPLPD